MPEQDTEKALAIVREALADTHPDASVRPCPAGPPGTIRVSLWDEDPADREEKNRWYYEQRELAVSLVDAGLLVNEPLGGGRCFLVTCPTRETVTYATADGAVDVWHLLVNALYTRCGCRTHILDTKEKLPDDQVCEPCRTGPVVPPRAGQQNLL